MIERISQRVVAQAIHKSQCLSRPFQFVPNHGIRLQFAPCPVRLPCVYRKAYVTSSQPKPPPVDPRNNTHEEPQPGPTEPLAGSPTKGKRSLKPYIFAAACFLVGATAGAYVKLVLAPPPPPIPGTPDDESLTASIHRLARNLPLVKSLSEDPAWISWHAYSTFTPAEKQHRLTTGPLAGARGLGGYQRVFRNAETGEFVSVLWIGGSVAGWPGVAHGGLIATVMDESLARCAISRFPAGTGVTANLHLKFKAPVVTNRFVVVRASPVLEGSTEKKGYVAGRMETLEGKVCVEAKGLFVVPKKIKQDQLKQLELVNLTDGF